MPWEQIVKVLEHSTPETTPIDAESTPERIKESDRRAWKVSRHG